MRQYEFRLDSSIQRIRTVKSFNWPCSKFPLSITVSTDSESWFLSTFKEKTFFTPIKIRHFCQLKTTYYGALQRKIWTVQHVFCTSHHKIWTLQSYEKQNSYESKCPAVCNGTSVFIKKKIVTGFQYGTLGFLSVCVNLSSKIIFPEHCANCI